MIRDIAPKVFHNSFQNKKAEPMDLFLSYDGDNILVREDKDKLWYPSFSDFEQKYPNLKDDAQFLFTIDDINYFLVDEKELSSALWHLGDGPWSCRIGNSKVRPQISSN